MVHGTEDGKDYLSIMPRIKGRRGILAGVFAPVLFLLC
jgi:hypothetical protein